MEIIKKYILHLLVVSVCLVVGLVTVVPFIPNIFNVNNEINVKKESVERLSKDVELARNAKLEKETALSEGKVVKQVYEPDMKSTDMMVNFNGMLETVLNLAKQAGLKTRNIEFKLIPEGDLVKQNHSNTHDSTLLVAQLLGTYSELQDFLRSVYRHEYLMGIYELKVSPYEADKKILVIDISLSLYSKK